MYEPSMSQHCIAPTGFAVGWGPIPWLLMSEIFPLHVKGVATGVCVLTNWFMAFLVTKEFSSIMVSADPCLPLMLSAKACLMKQLSLPEVPCP